MKLVAVVVVLIASLLLCAAQDPAQGWLGYAKGTNPAGNGRITYIEAKWKNLNNPNVGGAFFSPWFGIESSDNLNLIQPVNPWSGFGWSIYNEYFQWSPVHNQNSDAHNTNPGDILFGSVTFDEASQTYVVFHSDMTDGWNVTTKIPVQQTESGEYKNYTIAYFVFEKAWNCNQYPPDEKVLFYDITIEYEGQQVMPKWETSYVDDVCNNRAHVVSENSISITWDTSADNPPASWISPARSLHGDVINKDAGY